MFAKKSAFSVLSALLILLLLSSTASASSLRAVVDQQGVSFEQNSLESNMLNASETYFQENFESYTENSYPSSFTQIYDGCGVAEQKVVTTVGLDGTDSKVFRLCGQNNWASEHYVPLPSPLPAFLVVDAYVKPVSGNWPGGLRLRHPSGDWGTVISSVIFDTEGNITAGNTVIGSYSMGTWYRVTMEHNISQKKYAVYVNGVKLAEDLNMHPTLSPTQLELLGGNSGTNEIYFDNVSLIGDMTTLFPCTPPPPGMVSWWGGDNNALDMVSTNNGTLMGNTTYVAGMVGQAFSFDGAEASYVEIPDSAELNPSGAFSVDGWFYIDPAAVENVGQIATLVAKSQGSLNNGWSLYFDDRDHTKSLKFVLSTIVLAEYAIPTANWYHITGVYDPSATPQAILYINGVSIANSGLLTETVIPNSLSVRIGAMHWTDVWHEGNDRFNGKADEVEFFNRAITADEIIAIYNAGSAGKCRSCTPPPANMVSWWDAEGNANDIIGTNNGTMMNSATFASGMVGQAFSFDGVDDYVDIASTASLDMGTGDFTIDMWLNINSLSSDQTLFHKISGTGSAVSDPSYFVEFETPNGLRFRVGDGENFNDLIVSTSLVTRHWYHITAIRSGNTNLLYLDGNLIGSQTAGSNVNTGTGGNVVIGRCITSGCVRFVNGHIDEVEIFNRALSTAEIAAIYNAGSAGKCRSCTPLPANTVSWWDAEDDANDFIGTNHGTLTNGATFGPGKVGQAFSLDGVDDFVQVPDAPNLSFSPTSPLTIYMWAYPTTVTPAMHLIGKRTTCWDAGGSSNYQIAHDSTNGVAFNSGGTQLVSGQQLFPNQWQHIAVTADGTTFRIYIDGQEKASMLGTLGGQNTAPLDIGGVCSSDEGVKFPGLLDEITIVNRALAATEIAALYNAGSAGCCTSDSIPPTVVSVIRAGLNPTNAASVDFTVTFSESVTGVDSDDFTETLGGAISGASVSLVSGSGSVYSVTVTTGSGNGTLRLDVNPSSTDIQDLAGNPISNGYTSGEAYDIDKTAPSVTMSSTVSNPTDALPIPVTVQFSETVTGFTSDDIVTSNGTVSNFVAVDGDTYTFDLTPSTQGPVRADIAAGVATDSAGNANTAAAQFSRTYAPIFNLFLPLIQR